MFVHERPAGTSHRERQGDRRIGSRHDAGEQRPAHWPDLERQASQKVQDLDRKPGIKEGATLVAGGPRTP